MREYAHSKKTKLDEIEKLFTKLDYCLFDNKYYMQFKKQGTDNFSPCHVLSSLKDYEKKFIINNNRAAYLIYKQRSKDFIAKLNNKISC